jgi:hypothetical protein
MKFIKRHKRINEASHMDNNLVTGWSGKEYSSGNFPRKFKSIED